MNDRNAVASSLNENEPTNLTPPGKESLVTLLLDLIYGLLLLAVSPWLVYQSMRKGKYREGYAAKLFGCVPPSDEHDDTCLWLHAVSVGEVNLLGPLVSEIAHAHPDWRCVISTTTMTGYALAKTRFADHTVFYCPLDFSWAVRRAMRRVRPDVLVLAELELWPNLIRAAQRHGAKVAIINARLSDHSFRGYRRFKPLVSRLLRQVDLVGAQNDQYAERFLALGAPPAHVRVTGSIKFDGAQSDRDNRATRQLKTLAGFSDHDRVFLAGSTQHPEEQFALQAFLAHCDRYPDLRLVLVPRHPDRFDEVAQMLDRADVCWQRRSRLETLSADRSARILLVDTIGELGAWWGSADIAMVGGSLSQRGGQNMIEPAAYGAAICFGPNTWNFRDVVAAMLAAGAAEVVRDADEMSQFVGHVLEDPSYGSEIGSRAQELVRSQQGATRRTVALLADLVHGDTGVNQHGQTTRRQAA